jgi:hypothetical protein
MMPVMLAICPDDDLLGAAAVGSRAESWAPVHGKGAARARRVVVAGAVMLSGCGRLGFEGPGDGGTGDTASSAYAAVVLADQPLAYWRLDDKTDTAVDASGHGVAGVYGGGVTQGVPGALVGDPDTAVQFDGTNGQVAVGPGFDFTGTTAFSVEMWIKPTILDGNSRHVFTKQHRPDPKQGFALLVRAPDGLIFERFVNAAGVSAIFPVVFGVDFHHVVATYDGSVMDLYVDGTLSNQNADARPMPSISEPALIAATSEVNFFGGAIDEVAVYSTALPAARVQAHFSAGHAQAARIDR